MKVKFTKLMFLLAFLCVGAYALNAQSTSTALGDRGVIVLNEGFEGTAPATDWEYISMNTENAVTHVTDKKHTGAQSLKFTSWNPASNYDQYAITPQLSLTADAIVGFYYITYGYVEKFKVGYSTTGKEITDFIWENEVSSAEYINFLYYETTVPAEAKYVAVCYCTGLCNYNLYIDDFTVTLDVPTTADPTFSPENSEFEAGKPFEVTIECETEGAEIYYTMNGTDPEATEGGDTKLYTGPVSIVETTTFRAMAVTPNSELVNSNVVEKTYIGGVMYDYVRTDHTNVTDGIYMIVEAISGEALSNNSEFTSKTVSIEEDAIHSISADLQWRIESVEGGYQISTTDGSKVLYINNAWSNGLKLGTIEEIEAAEAAANAGSGAFGSVWTLDVTNAIYDYGGNEAFSYYGLTVDCNNYGTSGYPNYLFLTNSKWNSCNADDNSTAFYNIKQDNNIQFFRLDDGIETVAKPTINPAGGTYEEGETVEVTIECATEGATIYYTLDGNKPTTDSEVYSSPINITQTTTVKAFAVKDGYHDSGVATATYKIVKTYKYVKLENHSDVALDPEGIYIIVGNDKNQGIYKALSNGVSPTTGAKPAIDVTIETENGASIINSDDVTLQWKFMPTEGGYKISTLDGTQVLYSRNFESYYTLMLGEPGTNDVWELDYTYTEKNYYGIRNVTRNTLLGVYNNDFDASTFESDYANDQISIFKLQEEENPQPITDNFMFDFEDGTLNGLITIDADGDGYNWGNSANAPDACVAYNNSVYCAYSESYNNDQGKLYPNNYLVTAQKYAIVEGSTLTFYLCARDQNDHAEHYGVEISTTVNNDVNAFTSITGELVLTPGTKAQANWYEQTVDLSDYAGQEVYIAFRHYNCNNQYMILVDDIALTAGTTPEPIATPTFTPEEGTYTEAQSVTINAAEDAYIFFTTNGSDPRDPENYDRQLYMGPISVSETTTINAVATFDGENYSEIATATYTINISQDPYKFVKIDNPADITDNGTYMIVETNSGRAISNIDSNPVNVTIENDNTITNSDTELQWNLTKVGDNQYKISTEDGRFLYNNGGAYGEIAIGDGAEDLCIWNYGVSTSGTSYMTMQTVSYYGLSNIYEEADCYLSLVDLTFSNNEVWSTTSDIGELIGSQNIAIFKLQGEEEPMIVATPVFTPESGEYDEAIEVTIECETDGATIYYITNIEQVPHEYTGPITISETTTIMAYAVKEGFENSEFATATYTITIIPSGPSTFVKLDNHADVTDDGIYMIVCNDNSEGVNYALTSNSPADGRLEGKEVTVADNTIISDDVTSFWKITAVEGGYRISTIEGQVLYSYNGSDYGYYSLYVGATNSVNNVWELGFEDAAHNYYGIRNVNRELPLCTYFQGYGFVFDTSSDDYDGVYDMDNDKISIFKFQKEYTPTVVATPVFTPEAGEYFETIEVTIECETEDAFIYYTTDGNEPTVYDALYNGPITISETTTLKAFAMKEGLENSEVATAIYTITIIPIDPVRFVKLNSNTDVTDNGTYMIVETNSGRALTYDASVMDVNIVSENGKDVIYSDNQSSFWKITAVEGGHLISTLDGDEFLYTSGQYTMVSLGDGTTGDPDYYNDYSRVWNLNDAVPAYNYSGLSTTFHYTPYPEYSETVYLAISGWGSLSGKWCTLSEEGSLSYGDLDGDHNVQIFKLQEEDLETVATPTFTPEAGEYTESIEVTIECETEGATIYYAFDGETPTTSSLVYTEPIIISVLGETTIKAIAVKEGYESSAVATAIYTIVEEELETVATPTFSPEPGDYYDIVEITIECATEGATIYYTIEDSSGQFDVENEVYSGPIIIENVGDVVSTINISAWAVKEGYEDSEVAEATYNVGGTDVDENFAYTSYGNIILEKVNGKGFVKVVDIAGRIMMTENVTSGDRMNIETLHKGVYVIQLVDESGVKTQKILVK